MTLIHWNKQTDFELILTDDWLTAFDPTGHRNWEQRQKANKTVKEFIIKLTSYSN